MERYLREKGDEDEKASHGDRIQAYEEDLNWLYAWTSRILLPPSQILRTSDYYEGEGESIPFLLAVGYHVFTGVRLNIDSDEPSPNETAANAKQTRLFQHIAFIGLQIIKHLNWLLPLSTYNDQFNVITSIVIYADEKDPWTSKAASQNAQTLLLKTILGPSRDTSPALLDFLLREKIKPLFLQSKNPAVTSLGRKAIRPMVSKYDDDIIGEKETKPWKFDQRYMLTVFRWVLLNMNVCSHPSIPTIASFSAQRHYEFNDYGIPMNGD